MTTGFPYSDRRQRPCVMGGDGGVTRQARAADGMDRPHRNPAQRAGIDATKHCNDRTGADSRHGHSYVDIALVPGGHRRRHGDVMG